jgi:hypothetical protein
VSLSLVSVCLSLSLSLDWLLIAPEVYRQNLFWVSHSPPPLPLLRLSLTLSQGAFFMFFWYGLGFLLLLTRFPESSFPKKSVHYPPPPQSLTTASLSLCLCLSLSVSPSLSVLPLVTSATSSLTSSPLTPSGTSLWWQQSALGSTLSLATKPFCKRSAALNSTNRIFGMLFK